MNKKLDVGVLNWGVALFYVAMFYLGIMALLAENQSYGADNNPHEFNSLINFECSIG